MAGTKESAAARAAVDRLPPGKPRIVDLGDGVTARVYPMGLAHVREFYNEIGLVLGSVLGMLRPGELQRDGAHEHIVVMSLPLITQHLMGLVNKCVAIDGRDGAVSIDDLPHWDLPQILHAWAMENFGEERKWRPWVEAVESVLQQITGERISILETLSKSLSPQATASQTS